MMYEQFDLRSKAGETIRCDIRYVEDLQPKPIVLFLHGFKGFKDWGPFPELMERIAQSRFVAVSMNFSHNGIGENLQTFTELDRFAENTFTRELDEVLDVVRELRELDHIPVSIEDIDSERIGLLGHSRGAGMAILAGAESEHIKAVVALSPVSHFDRYSPRQKAKWRAEGKFEVLNQRTKQIMTLHSSFLDDLEANAERLSILGAASKYPPLQKPLLVMSGEQDLTTPTKEAEAIAESANGPLTELILVPHSGHTFGAAHPSKGITPALDAVLENTLSFFHKRL